MKQPMKKDEEKQQTVQASLQAAADAWAAGRSWTYMKGEHAWSPGTTSLYLANMRLGGVMGQR